VARPHKIKNRFRWFGSVCGTDVEQEGKVDAVIVVVAQVKATLVGNETDDILYPFRNGWQGRGSMNYGKSITSYVDDHPPDEFIHVKDGAYYGWPPIRIQIVSNGLDNMPFAPNYKMNPDWSRYPESMFTRVDKGIQAHSAPLGTAFFQDSKIPAPFREGIAIALHGIPIPLKPWRAAADLQGLRALSSRVPI
jgi:hypothetical protein